MKFPRIYLASQSPRRSELLQQISVDFSVLSVEVDETVKAGESPVDYVKRVAQEKAKAGILEIAQWLDKRPVLAADTAVVLNGKIFGKPSSLDDARNMLVQLSGQTHQVLSAVCVADESRQLVAVSTSDVMFADLTAEQLDWYLSTGEGADKAGAYAVQGLAAMFIEQIRGSYSGIMGLPLYETGQLLKRMENQSEQ